MFILLCTIVANLIADTNPITKFTFVHGNNAYTYTAYHNDNGDTDIILDVSDGFSDFWWECGHFTTPNEARIGKMVKYHLDKVLAA